MGNVYQKKGEIDKALEYYERDKEIRIRTHEENHPDLAAT